MVGVLVGFMGGEYPEAEKAGGENTGVDDVGEEEGDDDPVEGPAGLGCFGPDIIHQTYVALPDQKSDYCEIEIGGYAFGKGITVIVYQTGEVWDQEAEGGDAY